MPKKQNRDNNYYLGRLEKEHSSIHADLLAGKYGSSREAFKAAGLRKPPSALTQLKNAWQKANTEERIAFINSIEPGAVARAELEHILKDLNLDTPKGRQQKRR